MTRSAQRLLPCVLLAVASPFCAAAETQRLDRLDPGAVDRATRMQAPKVPLFPAELQAPAERTDRLEPAVIERAARPRAPKAPAFPAELR